MIQLRMLLAIVMIATTATGCSCGRRMRDLFYRGDHCNAGVASTVAPVYAAPPVSYTAPQTVPAPGTVAAPMAATPMVAPAATQMVMPMATGFQSCCPPVCCEPCCPAPCCQEACCCSPGVVYGSGVSSGCCGAANPGIGQVVVPYEGGGAIPYQGGGALPAAPATVPVTAPPDPEPAAE